MSCVVFLASCNGERFLKEQLDSILRQNYSDIQLYISDDRSDDRTFDILIDYQKTHGDNKISIKRNATRLGFCENFLSLVYDSKIHASFYAYADQDDIWLEDKISYAISQLRSVPKNVPALYCSRTKLINSDCEHIGYSPLFKKKPSFKNALVQNIAGGNTMVFNNAARKLLLEHKCRNIVSHDWWTYMLITGAGGCVFYDPVPKILYRQHQQNAIGSNCNFRAKMTRIKMLLQGQYAIWNKRNISALEKTCCLLTFQNKKLLFQFKRMRSAGLSTRMYLFGVSKLYRQTLLGQIGLWFSVCINRI